MKFVVTAVYKLLDYKQIEGILDEMIIQSIIILYKIAEVNVNMARGECKITEHQNILQHI